MAGEKVSLALEETLSETSRGEKEAEVVGRLCQKLWKDRIDPVTLMAAADDRVYRFRHPIPTEKSIERYLMVSVNARKWGLIVSLTRFVHFGKIPEKLSEQYLANVFIDCTFMAETPPRCSCQGGPEKGDGGLPQEGLPRGVEAPSPGGIHRLCRKGLQGPLQTPDLILENQAFTWNPSIGGTKSEDTIVAGNTGPEMITRPMIYPEISLTVGGIDFRRPAILEKE